MSTYEVTKITSQDELALAIKENKLVVEITGELKNNILENKNKVRKACKNTLLGTGMAYGVLAVLEVINPIISIPTMLYGLKKGLGGSVSLIKEGKKTETDVNHKYKLYFHPAMSETDEPVFLLIDKKFDLKYDTMADRTNCCFYDKRCSHCGNKIKDYDRKYKAEVLPPLCEKCQKLIFYKLA